MNVDLQKLTLLARGGEADIYAVGEDRVLRVSRKACAPAVLAAEQALYRMLESQNLPIPKVYERGEVAGMQAEIQERIPGGSLLDHWLAHPLCVKEQLPQFARLHARICSLRVDDGLLPSLEDKIAYLRTQPLQVEPEVFAFAMRRAQALPSGDALCHGDFHPGNILQKGEKFYIIDWSGAYRGNPVSDIAHTLLLMEHAPRTPGQSEAEHERLVHLAKQIAVGYLQEMRVQMPLDEEELEGWRIVLSLCRLYWGLPSEKDERRRYLRQAYLAAQDRQGEQNPARQGIQPNGFGVSREEGEQ